MEREEVMHDTKRIVWGVFMIGLGAVLLFAHLGVFGWTGAVHWWPMLFVLFGVNRLLEWRPGSALTLFLLGGWFLACEYGWWGLRYGNSWGLVLVAVGAGIVVRALSGEHRCGRGPMGGRL